jgi:caffeoyl-CoA O-methyltransferase
MRNNSFSDVDHYISSLLIHEDEILSSVSQTLKDANLPFSTITPNQGKFLHLMAIACNAKNILELGTLGGYSAVWLARALPETGRMITVELEEAHARVAAKNIARAGLSDKVEVRMGKAAEVMVQLKQEIGIKPHDGMPLSIVNR